MQAWQINRSGLDALRRVELPEPQPSPGEVFVRWRAQSLNYRDLVIVQGTYIPNLPLPFTPLSDAAGEVVAVGAGVAPGSPATVSLANTSSPGSRARRRRRILGSRSARLS